jgi:hypothetical protein
MAEIRDVLRLFITEAAFLAGSKRRQMGYDKTTKRLLIHNNTDDTLASKWSDDTLQCLLATDQTLTGLKTFNGNTSFDAKIIMTTPADIELSGNKFTWNGGAASIQYDLTDLVLKCTAGKIKIEHDTLITGTKKLYLNNSTDGAILTSDGTTLTIDSKKAGGAIYLQLTSVTKMSLGTTGIVAIDYFNFYNRTDANRGTPSETGSTIFNTNDGKLNIWNGANWTLPDGTVT